MHKNAEVTSFGPAVTLSSLTTYEPDASLFVRENLPHCRLRYDETFKTINEFAPCLWRRSPINRCYLTQSYLRLILKAGQIL